MRGMKHSEIIDVTHAIAEAKVINLDASLRDLVQPAASSIRHIGEEVSLHVLCCNEYALVTGITADQNLAEIRDELKSLKTAIGKVRN